MSGGINFFIHDLNPYGGQDRSTLEILTRLSRRMPVHVYAFTYENPAGACPGITFHRCPFPVYRPVLVKSILFHLWSAWVRLTHPRRLTFATGTCSLASEVVHVQFVAQAWKKEKHKLTVGRRGLRRPYHYFLARYNEWMETLLFSAKKTYAAISHGVAEDLRKNFPAERIEVIHHGVDPEKFSPPSPAEKKQLRSELHLPAGSPIFVFVGAYDRKGLATVVQAFRRLAADFPQARVVAVGNGDQAQYRRLAGENAHWLILRKPSKEIEKYYRAADYFVLPTLYEPFGLVILEAMSAGLPAVVSRQAGASELIRHGENGLLLSDPTSAEELEAALRSLLASPSGSARMAAQARAAAEARSWQNVANEFASLIEQKGGNTLG